MARKRLPAPVCVADGRLRQSSYRRHHALLRSQLLQELLSVPVPRSPIAPSIQMAEYIIDRVVTNTNRGPSAIGSGQVSA
jgi:hypothetical protein